MKVNHVRKCVSVCSFLNKHNLLKKQSLKFIWQTTTKTALDYYKINTESHSCEKVCFCVFFPKQTQYAQKAKFKIYLENYIKR